MALKIMEQQHFAERLKGLQLFNLQLRGLTGRNMVEVYKVMKVVGKVSVYLHSINATPPETGTLKEICRRLKMEAVLRYTTFGELPKHFCHGE